MKTEQLIVQYLYLNKKMILRDIGVFTVSPEINIDTDSEKDAALPENAISFDYDPKAGEDEGLVNYIVQQTRKIRPLAASDLESYSILNKQFLNIGKPLVLEGLGTLQKTQSGEYAFTQSGTSHVIREEAPKQVTEKQNEKVTFGTPPKEKTSGSGKAALLFLLAVLIVGGGITAYYFITNNKSEKIPAETSILTEDTSATADTAANTVKPATQTAVMNAADTNSFYIVIKEYRDRAAAEKSLQKLTSYGNKLVLTAKDSSTFKLRMPFMLPLTDTARIKDSLSRFFGARTLVELP